MANVNEKIYIGSVDTPTLSFDVNNIEDISYNNSVDVIGDELSSDTIEVNVFYDDADGVLFSQEYGTAIFYYSNNYLVGKYYINEIERIGLKRYRIRGTSLIGLIEKEEFYGGMYNGETFKSVVQDVLLTNGIDTEKYNIYTPINGMGQQTGAYPPVISQIGRTADAWKYRIHIDFKIIDSNYSGSSYQVLGSVIGQTNSYCVTLYARKSSVTLLLYWEIDVLYNNTLITFGSSADEKYVGNGSNVVVDVNPIDKTIKISIDYVRNDDPTITGHVEKTGNIQGTYPTTALYFNRAYGASSFNDIAQSVPFKLQWKSYKVYDENNNPVIDAVFWVSDDGSTYNITNAVDNYTVTTTYFVPYGELLGVVGNLQRAQRDAELSASLMFNEGVDLLPVRGWIRPTTRREALHQLLFSYNICMLKTLDGNILFTYLSGAGQTPIQEENIFDDSREESIAAARTIKVTEHSFTSGSSTAKLFDNTSGAARSGKYVVLFNNAPIEGDPVGDGITIISHNCNAAIVTGRGTITGTPYYHSENVVSYENNDFQNEKDVSVSGIGIITNLNSDSILNKLRSYYSGNLKKIKNGMVYNGERCGLSYSFKTLYSDDNVAFLTKISAIASSFVKAKNEFISGYVPPEGSGYTNYTINTYGDTWVIPTSVRQRQDPTIRVNIIGKGYAGTVGESGEDGKKPNNGSGKLPGGEGGKGGAAGTGGAGGNIYSLSINTLNVNKVVVSDSGYDTVVRTYDDGDTLISTYSSASGNPNDNGFINLFTGMIYARKGQDGVDGADGGKGGYMENQGAATDIEYVFPPESGNDVDIYIGGSSFDYVRKAYTSTYGTAFSYNSFGGGGGAAYGNNGGNAYHAGVDNESIYETYGGDGADAIVNPNPYAEYGSGGFGGNGGGGGGGAGARNVATPREATGGYDITTIYQNNGIGGAGSSGTPGIDGCVIIYY